MYKGIIQKFRFSGQHSFNSQLPFVNHTPAPYKGPSFEQVVKDRTAYMPSFYFHYYKTPVLIV